jgi:hypothetical protein
MQGHKKHLIIEVVEVQLHTFLTSVPDKWSASRPDPFTHTERAATDFYTESFS